MLEWTFYLKEVGLRKVDPEKHEERRLHILAAAERCFTRNGLKGATIASICAAADMSPGHLYHYFSSKEAIIATMTDRALDGLALRFERMMREPDVVKAFLSQFDRLNRKRHGHNALLILEVTAEASRNPAIAEIVQNRSRRLQGLLAGFLREGQRRGQIDAGIAVEPAAAILVNLIEGVTTLTIKDPGFDAAVGAKLFQRIVSRFLTPPAA